ncbi:MAG: hypothetical protein ACE5GJ_13415 [Gemmatimonadota bacterium]
MRTISDAVEDIVRGDPLLKTGLAQRLLNLSQVARYIHAAVEARTQKSVKEPSITMALSRLQAKLVPAHVDRPLRLAGRITVQRGLAVLTFPNTARAQANLPHLHQQIRSCEGYLTISEGIREVMLIVEHEHVELVRKVLGSAPSQVREGIASLAVGLTHAHLTTPGVLYRILQPLALQGINLVELASTTTEFHIYIKDEDVLLALDSLYAAFPVKRAASAFPVKRAASAFP